MNTTIAARSFPDNEIKNMPFYEAQKITEAVIFIHVGDKLLLSRVEKFLGVF